MTEQPAENEHKASDDSGVHSCPALVGYVPVTSDERNWVLSGAVGYFIDLELVRLPSQRLAANSMGQDSGLLLRFANSSFRKRLDRCLRKMRKVEESAIKLDWARSVGLGGSDDLLCLAAMQFTNAVKIKSRRFSREANSESQLWAAYMEFMHFCHTNAFSLLATYEEHPRRQVVDRKTERDPTESFADWRNRASAPLLEMRPISVQFVRTDDAPVLPREDRSTFHRRWIDKQIADAWQFGSVPFR